MDCFVFFLFCLVFSQSVSIAGKPRLGLGTAGLAELISWQISTSFSGSTRSVFELIPFWVVNGDNGEGKEATIEREECLLEQALTRRRPISLRALTNSLKFTEDAVPV